MNGSAAVVNTEQPLHNLIQSIFSKIASALGGVRLNVYLWCGIVVVWSLSYLMILLPPPSSRSAKKNSASGSGEIDCVWPMSPQIERIINQLQGKVTRDYSQDRLSMSLFSRPPLLWCLFQSEFDTATDVLEFSLLLGLIHSIFYIQHNNGFLVPLSTRTIYYI